MNASWGPHFHCPGIPWISQGAVWGASVHIQVLLCPESQTSNKINLKPPELTFCFPCLLKRAVRFALQTLRLFSKKTLDFHLSAENVTAAGAVLRLQTQRDLEQQEWCLLTSLLSDKSIKPLENQPHRSHCSSKAVSTGRAQPHSWETGPSAAMENPRGTGLKESSIKPRDAHWFAQKVPCVQHTPEAGGCQVGNGF